MRVTRPIVRYHGGKWHLAPWIIKYMPAHRVYVEPFGGGGSVLLRKPRSYAEVYNDLDAGMVNLFRVVRDHGAELARRIELTPFARTEFDEACMVDNDPIERARATVVRAFMGFGSNGIYRSTGFRANSYRSGTTAANDWRNLPANIPALIDRLRGVMIEHRDAFELIPRQDSAETLFYVDPPYLPDTRDSGRDYSHEMTADDHRRLADVLRSLDGAVMLSGYESDEYAALYQGWRCMRVRAKSDAGWRTECLWLSPKCASPQMEFAA